MEKLDVMGSGMALGEGSMLTPPTEQGGEPTPTDVIVFMFVSVDGQRTWHFSQPKSGELKAIAQRIVGMCEGAPEVAEQPKMPGEPDGPPDIIVPDRQPTKEELEKMSAPARLAAEEAKRMRGEK